MHPKKNNRMGRHAPDVRAVGGGIAGAGEGDNDV